VRRLLAPLAALWRWLAAADARTALRDGARPTLK
jgi:hypothetical protein